MKFGATPRPLMKKPRRKPSASPTMCQNEFSFVPKVILRGSPGPRPALAFRSASGKRTGAAAACAPVRQRVVAGLCAEDERVRRDCRVDEGVEAALARAAAGGRPGGLANGGCGSGGRALGLLGGRHRRQRRPRHRASHGHGPRRAALTPGGRHI